MNLELARATLEPAIWQCWNQIALDIFECAEACGDSVDNRAAIEACLDADRLLLVCNLEHAHAVYKQVVKAHGWNETVDFFDLHIKLV